MRSLCGCNGAASGRCGFTAIAPVAPSPIVNPSAGDLATAIRPSAPPAPALLSTTTGCPRTCESSRPTIRAIPSADAPGANGTISVIGLAGGV